MKLLLRYHVLLWGSALYFVVSESVGASTLAFYPIIVLLPWLFVVRSRVLVGQGGESYVSVSPLLWTRFVLVFIKEFLLANWDLLKILWSSKPAPEPEWTEVRTQLPSTYSQVLVANFISLTPGTISYELESDAGGAVIRVHVLNGPSRDSLQPLVDRLDRLLMNMAEERGVT